jgi:hypothetical protein
VALLPKQQALKQYRSAEQEMDDIIATIVGFAQVNGRLPCPADPDSLGEEVGGGLTNNCTQYGGFVPANTLGFSGRLNGDTLLLDPWGNPYRYYVSSSDVPVALGGTGTSTVHDFVRTGEMKAVGLVSTVLANYLNLDGQFLICDAAGTSNDDRCTGAGLVFGRPNGAGGPYAGAPFVLLSQGKNWKEGAAAGDELENLGGSRSDTDLGMGLGPTNAEYVLKNIAAGETTFVKRTTGFADDFDDIVKWVSPNTLFSKMIEAGQLP